MTSQKMGGNKKKNSEKQKKRYLIYKTSNQAEYNKLLKLERHLKKHPNDVQSKERRPANFPKLSREEKKKIIPSFSWLWNKHVLDLGV